MTERSATHATFTIERTYDAAPARVFGAWATPDAKRRWFSGPAEWEDGGYELDFRVGGREHSAVGPAGGQLHRFDALYHDIVPNERIVYSYDMHIGEARISVSLATVEFKPAGAGTRMIFTEQAVFLDGYDDAGSREQGSNWLLDKLGEVLAHEPAKV